MKHSKTTKRPVSWPTKFYFLGNTITADQTLTGCSDDDGQDLFH